MWEVIGEILTSGNGIVITVAIVAVVIWCGIEAKKGIIKIKTKNISVGKESREAERDVVRNQYEWTVSACEAFVNHVPVFEGRDDGIMNAVIHKCIIEIARWIMLNHIHDTKSYIKIKQDVIWNLVQKHVRHKKLTSDEFRAEVDAYVDYIIKNLVTIRKEFD